MLLWSTAIWFVSSHTIGNNFKNILLPASFCFLSTIHRLPETALSILTCASDRKRVVTHLKTSWNSFKNHSPQPTSHPVPRFHAVYEHKRQVFRPCENTAQSINWYLVCVLVSPTPAPSRVGNFHNSARFTLTLGKAKKLPRPHSHPIPDALYPSESKTIGHFMGHVCNGTTGHE